jgi:hypothetical protein
MLTQTQCRLALSKFVKWCRDGAECLCPGFERRIVQGYWIFLRSFPNAWCGFLLSFIVWRCIDKNISFAHAPNPKTQVGQYGAVEAVSAAVGSLHHLYFILPLACFPLINVSCSAEMRKCRPDTKVAGRTRVSQPAHLDRLVSRTHRYLHTQPIPPFPETFVTHHRTALKVAKSRA